MIVDGNAIAADIYTVLAREVADLSRVPVMAAVTCAPNFETQKYLALKKRKAAAVGISLVVIELDSEISTEAMVEEVRTIAASVDGVVVQLPFPAHIDREALLAAIPTTKDPDCFSYGDVQGALVPPVPGAIIQIAHAAGYSFQDKKVVILGEGRLVGLPTAKVLQTQGVTVSVLTEATFDAAVLKEADVVITGIGKPHFVTPDLVREGVCVFDAGTSEDGGLLVGDVHPEVAKKAVLFTPVPGGIGPVTVAILLQNVVALAKLHST